MERNDRMIGDVYDNGDELLKNVSGEMKVKTFMYIWKLSTCFGPALTALFPQSFNRLFTCRNAWFPYNRYGHFDRCE